jgi:hypothetical protein
MTRSIDFGGVQPVKVSMECVLRSSSSTATRLIGTDVVSLVYLLERETSIRSLISFNPRPVGFSRR